MGIRKIPGEPRVSGTKGNQLLQERPWQSFATLGKSKLFEFGSRPRKLNVDWSARWFVERFKTLVAMSWNVFRYFSPSL